jgi:uncharacterized protein YacL
MENLFENQSEFIFFLIVLVIALASLVLTRKLLRVPFPYFFMGVLGASVGLLIGTSLGKSLINLPGVYGRYLPIVVEVFVSVAIFDLFMAQAGAAANFLQNLFKKDNVISSSDKDIIIDTSALIDGRLEEIVQTGFIGGNLLIPKFVLSELQAVADSENPIRRTKGRRGLEMVSGLQQNRMVEVKVVEEKLKEREKVDSRLVKMAKERKAKLITVDYNLSQVAQIQGVEVLNINALASAMKPQLLPGDELTVRVVQKGKEKGQGVGYLEDGTMIILEDGEKYIGKDKLCEVVRVHQTISGKMVFVQVKI